MAGMPGRTLIPGLSELGIAGAYRPDHPYRGGCGAGDVGDSRPRSCATATRCLQAEYRLAGECLELNQPACRVAYSADFGYATVDREIARICAAAAERFVRDLGCIVEHTDPDWYNPWDTFAALEAMETDLVGLRRLVAEHGAPVSPSLQAVLDRPWTAEAFTDAIVGRKAVCNAMARLMQRYDLLLTPTVATQAFAAELDFPPGLEDWAPFTYPMNMTGQPASSVVAGWNSAGLPVGLQIAGRHLDDALVLRASGAFEQLQPWAQHRPPL